MPAFQPVEAVLRSLSVLEVVSRLESCGAQEIHAATGLSRATVIRMLETLEFAGYVARHPTKARYSLTSRVRLLNAGYRATDELASRATPMLADLQRQVAWPCDLAVYDGAEMVVVGGNPNGRLFYNRGPGYRAPVLGTSLGMAYIAFAGEMEQERVIAAGLGRREPSSLRVEDRDDIRRRIEHVRALGYAQVDHGPPVRPSTAGLAALAVPILVADRPVAAVNVVFLRDVLEPRDAPDKLLAPLKEAASRIATAVQELFREDYTPASPIRAGGIPTT